MPSYSYPGIYIQELAGAPGPIVGASPSTLAVVGWTLEGPGNEPVLVTSFPEFAEKFGSFTEQSNLPTSVFAFFQNGGALCRVVRVAPSDSVDASTILLTELGFAENKNPDAGPAIGQTNFVFTGVNALERLPLIPGSAQISVVGGSAEVFDDDGSGGLTGDSGGVGTIDYGTGEFTLALGTPATGAESFEALYSYANFTFTMKWPGVVGDEFRLEISGDPNFEDLLSASFSKFVIEVQRLDVDSGLFNTVESFSGLSLTDPSSSDYLVTVLNDDVSGSRYVRVRAWGNDESPASLEGNSVSASGVLLPFPNNNEKQFTSPMPTSINPFTYQGQIDLCESGVVVGLGDATPAPAVSLPGWAGLDIDVVSAAKADTKLLVNWTKTGPAAKEAWVDGPSGAGGIFPLTDGIAVQGSIDTNTGVLSMLFNAGDEALAGTDISVDIQYQKPVTIGDDGTGNVILKNNEGPSHITLNPGGVNLLDYGDETSVPPEAAVLQLMLKASDNPARGPSPAVAGTSILGTTIQSDYLSQPEADEVQVDMSGGSDGSALTRSTVSAPSLAADEKGLYALNKTDDLMQVIIPDFETDPTVSGDLIDYCENRMDRFAILSVPEGLDANEAANYKKVTLNRSTSYAALYYPHIQIIDPVTGKARLFPSGGHIAGVYARTDDNRNVSKAPAGTVDGVLRFSTGLEFTLTPAQVGVVNLSNVNALVQWEYTGRAVWGARTLENAGEFPYIQMRRLFMYLEKSVFNNTWGFVFENNGAGLQAQVKFKIESFLLNLFTQGYFSGNTPGQAFFVICDASNNPPENVAKGILTCDIGVAPTRPAEFVLFRFQQKALEG